MKKRTGEILVFAALELLLYALFLYYDLCGISGNGHFSSTGLKFLGIALCFLAALHWSSEGGNRLMAWALGFTVAADVCLLLIGSYYLVGVGCFCVVQALYFCRILRMNGGKTLWWLRALLFALVLGALWYLGQLTPLHAMLALYGTTFLCNVIQSLGSRTSGLFLAGILLYLLCDLCLALCYAPIELSGIVSDFLMIATWMFYLPGQVLLVLSGLPGKGR